MRTILALLFGLLFAAQAHATGLGVGGPGGGGSTDTISIATIGTQTDSVGFNINGGLSGLAVATGVDYQKDCTGSWTALSSPTITSTTWTSTGTPISFTAGTHSVCVREQPSTSITAASNSFTVNPVDSIAITTPGNQIVSAAFDSFGGTWTGGTTPTGVDLAFSTTASCPGTGSWATLGGSFTAGSPWSSTGTVTIGSTGTYYACVRMTNATSITGISNTTFTVSPAYSGPGDLGIASVYRWGGLRAYSAATRGTAAVNVCNSTGGTDVGCGDLSTDATTGQLVAATISGITCPGANCTVKTLYDQTGNGHDWTQATVANRPTLDANVIGSLPGMHFVPGATCNRLMSTVAGTTNQPYSYSVVAERTGTFTAYNAIYTNFDSANGSVTYFLNSTNAVTMYAGAFQNAAGIADSAPHALQFVFNGASSSIYADGTSTSTNPGGGYENNTASIGDGPDVCSNSVALTGYIFEAGEWHADITAKESALNSNQHTFWGF